MLFKGKLIYNVIIYFSNWIVHKKKIDKLNEEARRMMIEIIWYEIKQNYDINFIGKKTDGTESSDALKKQAILDQKIKNFLAVRII